MAMARPPRNSRIAELARRLNQYQTTVRGLTGQERLLESARLPALSGTHRAIVARLRTQSPRQADSLEQAMADIDDKKRRTYVGPAGEAREVMRAAIQLFAPDEEVRRQTWFRGVKQGDQVNPTQAERLRYAVQQRGGDYRHATESVDTIDEKIGRLGRNVYQRASSAFHAENQRQEVRKLAGWVFAVLDEVLPE
jgi:hypothetical protein